MRNHFYPKNLGQIHSSYKFFFGKLYKNFINHIIGLQYFYAAHHQTKILLIEDKRFYLFLIIIFGLISKKI